MNEPRLTLTLLPGLMAVCQLPPETQVPDWATRSPFLSTTRTSD